MSKCKPEHRKARIAARNVALALAQERIATIKSGGARWAPVAGFPGYEVSDDGRVLSLRTGLEKAQGLSNSGYRYTSITVARRHFGLFIHRLVAEAFCPGKSSERNVVNHLDGQRAHNHWSNLVWCTPSENMVHAVRELKTLTPPVFRGTANAQHRGVVRIDPKSGAEVAFATLTEAAAEGFDIRGIYAACCGEQQTHYGYRWRYAGPARTKNHNPAGPRA